MKAGAPAKGPPVWAQLGSWLLQPAGRLWQLSGLALSWQLATTRLAHLRNTVGACKPPTSCNV